MINLSDSSVEKIKDLLAEEGNPNLKLRVFVQGGGCSGMQYGFTFDELQNEDDFTIEKNSVFASVGKLLVIFNILCLSARIEVLTK